MKHLPRCRVEGCVRNTVVRGFCKLCYGSLRYHYRKYLKDGAKHFTAWDDRVTMAHNRVSHVKQEAKANGEPKDKLYKGLADIFKELKKLTSNAA